MAYPCLAPHPPHLLLALRLHAAHFQPHPPCLVPLSCIVPTRAHPPPTHLPHATHSFPRHCPLHPHLQAQVDLLLLRGATAPSDAAPHPMGPEPKPLVHMGSGTHLKPAENAAQAGPGRALGVPAAFQPLSASGAESDLLLFMTGIPLLGPGGGRSLSRTLSPSDWTNWLL